MVMIRRGTASFTAALAAGLAGLALLYTVHERRRRATEAAAAVVAASGTKPGACPVKLVILFSGKRKSGKDYATDRLLEALVQRQVATGSVGRSTSEIGRLSAPLKRAFADEHGLDYQELLSDGPYKEKYRAAMVTWGEAKRNADPGYFARLVVGAATADILIVSDARRATDLDFFRRPAAFGCAAAAGGSGECSWQLLTVRVECSIKERRLRGFVYDWAVDAAPSECGLDAVQNWDATLRNDGDAARPAPETAPEGGGGSGAPAERVAYAVTPARRGGVIEQIAAIAEHAANMLRL
jgi:phosphomevalonate kinase